MNPKTISTTATSICPYCGQSPSNSGVSLAPWAWQMATALGIAKHIYQMSMRDGGPGPRPSDWAHFAFHAYANKVEEVKS